MLDFPSLITDIAIELNDSLLSATVDGRLSRDQIMGLIERESQDLLVQGKKARADAFRDSVDISFVVDQSTYDLPESAEQVMLVTPLNSDGTEDVRNLFPIRFRNRNDPVHLLLQLGTGVSQGGLEGYHVEQGRPLRILFRPTPQTAVANAIRVFYLPRQIHLHTGRATAGAANSITFPATPTVGTLVNRIDYYNGAQMEITGGTGAGQRNVITDFANLVATVRDTWGTIPDATSDYAIFPRVPDSARNALLYGVTLRAARIDDDQDPSSIQLLASLYREAKSIWINGITDLQVDQPRTIRRVFDEWTGLGTGHHA